MLEAVLNDLREPDWTENDYEAAVLSLVRSAKLTEPICQAPMVLGGEPVRIDFLWPVERVALEARRGVTEWAVNAEWVAALAAWDWF